MTSQKKINHGLITVPTGGIAKGELVCLVAGGQPSTERKTDLVTLTMLKARKPSPSNKVYLSYEF